MIAPSTITHKNIAMECNRSKTVRTFAKLITVALVSIMTPSCALLADNSTPAPRQKQDQIEALAAHNKVRAQHHAPKLVWDETLARYAARHASKCQFKHSSSPYGENLAAGYATISAAVNAWNAEQTQYRYNKPGFSSSTGHFTQMVWKSSKELGCGSAVCDGKNGTPGIYWVCEYNPAGNVTNSGYFKANVLPASFRSP
jgi:uncharacterized protein YkwD